MSHAKDRGAELAFLTLTAAHAPNEPLQRSVEAVETAWKRARAGRPGKRIKDLHGLLGAVPVIDVTHGVKGWHFHIHAVVVTNSPHNASVCADLLAERYERALCDVGLNVSGATTDHTDVYDEEGLAKYLAKHWRIEPGDGGETPMHLLALGMPGSPQDFELYLEAMAAFQHKHRGVISPQLRRAINMI